MIPPPAGLPPGTAGSPASRIFKTTEGYRDGEWKAVHFGSAITREYANDGIDRCSTGPASKHIRWTLLHELGHAGDDAACPMPPGENYGPDGEHFGNEMLPPATAFTEGWADYVATRAGLLSVQLPALPEADASSLFMVFLEAAAMPGAAPVPGGVPPLAGANVPSTWVDRVAVENGVMAVLLQVEARVGWPAIKAAFRATQGEGCRTLATFLGALGADPVLRPQVVAGAQVGLGLPAPHPGVAALVAGQLPGCMSATEMPRRRPSRAPYREDAVLPEPPLSPGCEGLVTPPAPPAFEFVVPESEESAIFGLF